MEATMTEVTIQLHKVKMLCRYVRYSTVYRTCILCSVHQEAKHTKSFLNYSVHPVQSITSHPLWRSQTLKIYSLYNCNPPSIRLTGLRHSKIIHCWARRSKLIIYIHTILKMSFVIQNNSRMNVTNKERKTKCELACCCAMMWFVDCWGPVEFKLCMFCSKLEILKE